MRINNYLGLLAVLLVFFTSQTMRSQVDYSSTNFNIELKDAAFTKSANLPVRINTILDEFWIVSEEQQQNGFVNLIFDLSQSSVNLEDNVQLIVSENPEFSNYMNFPGELNTQAQTLTFSNIDLGSNQVYSLAYVNELNGENQIDFNGIDRYIALDKSFDLHSEFTVSAWVKIGELKEMAILAKRDNVQDKGIFIGLNQTGQIKLEFTDQSVQQMISNTVLPLNKWHNISIVYKDGNATILIDGMLDSIQEINSPGLNSVQVLLGASGEQSVDHFFNGSMDDIRIWNRALDAQELAFFMNQEIIQVNGMVNGSITSSHINSDTSLIPWTDLNAYFSLNRISGNCLVNHSENLKHGQLFNFPNSSLHTQTAPMPYKTISDGNWDDVQTWLNGNSISIPASESIVDMSTRVGWNIVQIDHNVTINNNNELRNLSALMINGSKLTVTGSNATSTGMGLEISNYLKLDGVIDLEGESQLIQPKGSVLDPASTGTIERDQQGTADNYTYNYWSSPVGSVNAATNNNPYTLPQVMHDGSQDITWLTSGYDGSAGSPVSIADYWIWKFANQPGGNYSGWQHIRGTGMVNVAEGYTMKGPGSGTINDQQNYVFKGKPNNGTIALTIHSDNEYLIGNPYPSAIDAKQFILDNSPLSGDLGLFFWEHYGAGTHSYSEYQGGYAVYNLSGGLPAARYIPAGSTNEVSVGENTPGPYIPVGQGFFVIGKNNGQIEFNNGQRIFKPESDESVFLKSTDNTIEEVDNRPKIRLGFDSVNGVQREILITQDANATTGIDFGYDAQLYEDQIDDMYWLIADGKHVIQGIDMINADTVLPLGVHTQTDGINAISINSLENFDENLDIFLHDKVLNVFHDLVQSAYTVTLDAGAILDRFELTFKVKSTLSLEDETINQLDIRYDNSNSMIVIKNPNQVDINSVTFYNMLGQPVFNNSEIGLADSLKYKVNNLSTGAYIVAVSTPRGKETRTVLVK